MSESAPPLYTRAFWTACALHFTGGMSFGMFLLFPLFIRQLGGDELTIGLVIGVGIATSVVLRPTVGALLDRLGRRRVLFWGTIANAASLPPFLLLGSPGMALYVLSIIHFVAGGTLFAAYFTYASDLVPATRRVEGIAIFGVAGMAPNGLGPALGELLIARVGFAGFFAVATAFALLSLSLITTIPRTTPIAEPVRASLLERVAGVWREMVRMLLHGGLGHILGATALFGAGVGAAFYFVAPFTRDLGLAHAFPFFAAYASSTIALRILGRRLPDRLGAGRVAPPSLAVFGLGLALLCFLPAPGALIAAGIACGAGHGSLFPVMNALTVGRTPFHLQGLAVSLYTAALDLGQTLGTPIGGAIARAAGYRVMFATMAVAALGGLALMVLDRRRIAP